MAQRYRSDGDTWKLLKPVARQMRKEPTPAEAALWQALRGGRVEGVKFRRQHAIGRYVVDFFAAQPRLVIEVDGPIHGDQQDGDASRDDSLRAQGVRILRFRNEQILNQLPWVLGQITQAIATNK